MCVCVRAPRLFPAVPGWGVLRGRACWARVSAVPCPSWLGCWGVCAGVRVARFSPALPGGFCVAWGCAGVAVLCFFWGGACRVLALWCRLLAVPVSGLVVSVPRSPLSRAALLAFFFLVPAWCVTACFGCPFSRWAAAPGLVLPVLAGWSPCAPLGGPVVGALSMRGLAASCGVVGQFGGCGPIEVSWAGAQDLPRVPARCDDQGERGGARVLLPDGLSPVVGAAGPRGGGGQQRVGQTSRHVSGWRDGRAPGGSLGGSVAHKGAQGGRLRLRPAQIS